MEREWGCWTLTMKLLFVGRPGGPDALAVRDGDELPPHPGRRIVRVAAGGVNFADIMTATGGYPGTPAPPFVAGRGVAGGGGTLVSRVMGDIEWGALSHKIFPKSYSASPLHQNL